MIFKHLLPRAAAWSLTINKPLRQFFEGLSGFIASTRLFFDLVWFDIFPDTTREIDAWEQQFGLSRLTLTEQERRDRLTGAWAATGGQSPRYIQDTLQAQGFPVYVHEWWQPGTQPPVAHNPLLLLRESSLESTYLNECGEPLAECGELLAECGETLEPVGYPLVNIILQTEKLLQVECGEVTAICGEELAVSGGFQDFGLRRREYVIPDDPTKFPYFLYLGAEVFPSPAFIPQSRKLEFERLCLKICPAQQWLGMRVKYN